MKEAERDLHILTHITDYCTQIYIPELEAYCKGILDTPQD